MFNWLWAAIANRITSKIADNFITRPEYQSGLTDLAEQTKEYINESVKFASKYTYFKNRETKETKDELIRAKALILGVPPALIEIGLAKLKTEYRDYYLALTPEVINSFTIEKLNELLGKKTTDENKPDMFSHNVLG